MRSTTASADHPAAVRRQAVGLRQVRDPGGLLHRPGAADEAAQLRRRPQAGQADGHLRPDPERGAARQPAGLLGRDQGLLRRQPGAVPAARDARRPRRSSPRPRTTPTPPSLRCRRTTRTTPGAPSPSSTRSTTRPSRPAACARASSRASPSRRSTRRSSPRPRATSSARSRATPGYYVIEVAEDHAGNDHLPCGRDRPDQADARRCRASRRSRRRFQANFQTKWIARTFCADGYRIDRCANAEPAAEHLHGRGRREPGLPGARALDQADRPRHRDGLRHGRRRRACRRARSASRLPRSGRRLDVRA